MIENKKIFITGAGGFVGSYFLERLMRKNDVFIILRKSYKNYWRLRLFEKNYRIIKCDLTSKEDIIKVLKREKPDITLHFAAYGAYPATQKDIEELIKVNVIGTINLIEGCIKYSDISIIVGSSSEYGEVKTPMKEEGPTNPNLLYGATKLFTTNWAKIRARDENKSMFIVRPFSIYGPYEEPRRLIPYLLSRIILNKEIELSSPTNVRDFIFIEDFFDALNFLIKQADKLEPGEIINIGSGKETSIEELVKILEKQIVKRKLNIRWGKASTQKEIKSWYADIRKIKKIGFMPRYKLKDGLLKTKEWIEKNIQYYKVD
ncbi:MAG: NAD-dependent epimerase/dehydratase family protein [Candidatus Anstonellaceae archaeon]